MRKESCHPCGMWVLSKGDGGNVVAKDCNLRDTIECEVKEIEFEGSYEDCLKFISRFEKANPSVSFFDMGVSGVIAERNNKGDI